MDMETNDSIRLNRVGSQPDAIDEIPSLPPVDGGKDAWIVLAGAFVLECVVWGFPFAFGVFQRYFLAHEPFQGDPIGIAAISTTASGIMYLSSPFVALLLQRYPRIRRPLGFAGLATMIGALLGASFSNSTGALLVTQGILYALGGLTLYFPAMYVIDEWFVARKGLAFGVVWTGTGTSGAIVPFLVQWLLDRYGFRTALRVWTVIMTALALPASLVMKNRIPPSQTATLKRMDFTFLKRSPFWIFQLGNFCQSMAFFLPQLWLPSFASALGLPSFSGPLALCLLNVAACGGYMGHGWLVDCLEVPTVMLLSTLVSTMSILVLWGLTASQTMLYVFSIVWGLSGGGFASTWSGCAKEMGKARHRRSSTTSHVGLANMGNNIDTGLVIGLMCVSKGIASLVSGPVSEMLLHAPKWHEAEFAYGTQYGPMILFAGVMVSFGASSFVGRLFKIV